MSFKYIKFFLSIIALMWAQLGQATFTLQDTYSFERKNGSQITYYLQRNPHNTKQNPLLLVLQGSQAESVFDHGVSKQNIPEKFKTALLMVEKPGVIRGSQDCSQNYKEHNSLDDRVLDILSVLESLKNEEWWNGKLYLLGGSEGGALAVKLTEKLEVERAVLLVTGGGLTMEEVLPQVLRNSMNGAPEDMIEKEIARLPQIFSDIKSNPDSTKNFFGDCNTYRYWNSVLWFRPVETMLKTQTKYLLVHGDSDLSHPIESARITADLFQSHAPHRLEYWEMPGLDHAFDDEKGRSFMGEIVYSSLNWLFAKE